jgi:hypothetical protein
MNVSGNLLLVIALYLLCCSCNHRVECTVADYSHFDTAKLPEWECHQTFSKGHDSRSGDFLEVTAFPKKAYPGITLPWLNGNWGHYKTLGITTRARRQGSHFVLSIWDGRGEYVCANRFEKPFDVDTTWTACELPLSGGLTSPANRRLDISRISLVVFFTGKADTPTVFDVGKIELH